MTGEITHGVAVSAFTYYYNPYPMLISTLRARLF